MSDTPPVPPAADLASAEAPLGFEQLAASRKRWIEAVLKPWAQRARRSDLCRAELEWTDLAGKVDPQKTLWLWAWSRFPALVHEDLGIDEAAEVVVRLRDGREFTGYPDGRESTQGQLVLLPTVRAAGQFVPLGPFSLDDIASVRRAGDDR
jgi:hypothetical protein